MSKEETLPAGADAVDHQPVELAVLPRAQIVRSRTNPRTHFDPAYIQELATSIREHGILQPLLVRPLPGDRLQETFEDREHGAPLPTHEIVCGECRYRGAALAEVDAIPVLIRQLTDIQVLQVQLVENLKRRDLHPLEEAEGFERLMKDHGMAVPDIAAKVDKSVSQIYVTLKLLELTPECREELYAGKLTRSTALLVARAPAYLQVQIARDIMKPQGFDNEPMSYRQAQRHIHQHYMLKLGEAVFDIKDASLLPKAGACSTCAKNTGANADMFEDVKDGDRCTDQKCFESKKAAHFKQVADAAAARGQTVIQGKEAKELIAYEGARPTGYKLLDEKDYIGGGQYQSLRRAIGKENLPPPVIIIDPHTKEAKEALPVDVADKLLKKATAQKKAAKADAKKTEPLSKQQLEAQFVEAWQAKAIEQLHGAILAGKSPGITVPVARRIAMHYADISLYGEAAEQFAKLFDVPAAKVASSAGVEDFLATCDDSLVGPALLVLMAMDECERHMGRVSIEQMPVLQLLTADAGVDLPAIQEEVKATMKADAEARKKEQQEKAAPKTPLQKKITARAKKTGAADAKAGIAQALQQEAESANDFEVGQRVQFKMDLKGHDGKVRKVSGREGTLAAKVGDRAWSVRYGKKPHEVATANYTELEHLKADGDDGLGAGEVLLANGVKLEPQPAWPFPPKKPADKPAQEPATSTEPTPNAALSAWPFPISSTKKSRKAAAA